MWRTSHSSTVRSKPFISAICLFRNHINFIANTYLFKVSACFSYVSPSTVNYGIYTVNSLHSVLSNGSDSLLSPQTCHYYTISRWIFYWQLCTLDVNSQNLKSDPVRLQVGRKLWHLTSYILFFQFISSLHLLTLCTAA